MNHNHYSHLVTTALYYANGELHIGHILEAVQADIYVRFLKQNGMKPLFISGSDAHGTPIMLASKNKGISPDKMVAQYKMEHAATFKQYDINFCNFTSTDASENRELTEEIFHKISGKIFTKNIEQAYDSKTEMFLPDRMIKGTCPKCSASDQYGDSCEKCGSFYDPLEMKDAISTISGTKPTKKSSEHLFFDLTACKKYIDEFLQKAELKIPVKNKLSEWVYAGLNPWDISRDAPYYGFEIPGYKNKYFYVWVDAPIGYIAGCSNLSKDNYNLWQKNSSCKIIHFIGKDIMYFHGLFWPAMLAEAEFKTPNQLVVHGFLTLNGKKMSKSRGTSLTAKQFLTKFSANHFRYYIASKINSSVEDIDLNLEDLIQKINSDIIGKYLNIASRTASFINKKFNHSLLEIDLESRINKPIIENTNMIINCYQELEFATVCREIMALADHINREIAEIQPWNLIKQENKFHHCHKFCSNVIYAFIDLSILLKPIMPKLIQEVEAFLNLTNLNNLELHKNRSGHKINEYPRLMERIPAEYAKDVYE